MKVLILGGTRYLGKSIFSILSKDKQFYKVATFSRNKTSVSKLNHFICDRKDIEKFYSILKNFKPNIIIDMINYDTQDSESIVNAYDKNILSELKHYIMISTFFVYNYYEYNLFGEKYLTKKLINKNIDNYTLKKISSENILYFSNIMNLTSIIRLPFIFSSDDYTGRFQNACDLALNQNGNHLNNSFKYSLISKNFAAKGIKEICLKSPQNIIDLGNSRCVSSKDIYLILKKTINSKNICTTDNKINFPYNVKKNICLKTNKIHLRENLIESLKKEMKNYLLKSNK